MLLNSTFVVVFSISVCYLLFLFVEAFAIFMSCVLYYRQYSASREVYVSKANTKRTAEIREDFSFILGLLSEKSERYKLIDGASHTEHRSDTEVSRYRA